MRQNYWRPSRAVKNENEEHFKLNQLTKTKTQQGSVKFNGGTTHCVSSKQRTESGGAWPRLYSQGCYSQGHCTHKGLVLTRALYSQGHCTHKGATHKGTVLTRALYSQGPCTHKGPVLTRALYSQGPCTHKGPVLIRALYSQGHCTHKGPVLTRALYSQGHCTHKGTVLTRALYSQGPCTHKGTVLTRALYSQGPCTHKGTVLTRALYSQGPCTYKGTGSTVESEQTTHPITTVFALTPACSSARGRRVSHRLSPRQLVYDPPAYGPRFFSRTPFSRPTSRFDRIFPCGQRAHAGKRKDSNG